MRKAMIYSTLVLLLITTIAACGGPAPAPTAKPEPTEEPTMAEPQQVTAGMQAYDSNCSRCHGATLVDGFAPKLSKPTLAKYGTAQDLFNYLRQSMPKGNPGSLSEQEYYDVISYLLFRQDLLEAPQVVNSETASSITLSE
jgi:polar amino acid transport system substrate-binding protein